MFIAGWNSWNHFGSNIDKKLIRKTTDSIVSSGLAAAGYEYGSFIRFCFSGIQLFTSLCLQLIWMEVGKHHAMLKVLSKLIHKGFQAVFQLYPIMPIPNNSNSDFIQVKR
jgi:hypothetical protein